MNRFIVTGAAGCLGAYLTKQLVASGHEVIAIDNLSSGRYSGLEALQACANFTFIEADVCEQSWLSRLPSDIHGIYHLASPASPKFYQAAPLQTIAVNTIGLKQMLDLAQQLDAKLLYTSTSEVYGDPLVHPQRENYRGNVNTWGPRACYDEAKRLGEVYCYEYWKLYGLQVKVVRLFNTYSPDMRSDDGRVISNFVQQALTGADLTVYGDGSQTRSYCFVDDTIRALQMAMDSEQATGEIINIGNPGEYTVLETAELVLKLTGSSSKVVFRPMPADDPMQRRPVIDKALQLLGWQPRIGLEAGLQRMIEAFDARLKEQGVSER